MIEAVFVDMVGSQSAITSIIGDGSPVDVRLHPEALPQNATYPAATYQIISGPRDYVMEGPDGVTTFRVQLDLYALEHVTVCALRDAVEASLSGLYNLPFGGSPAVVVQGVFVLNERSRFESQTDLTPPGAPYRKSLDLAVTVTNP